MRLADMQALVSSNTDPCMLVDSAGRVVYANEIAHRALGYSSFDGVMLGELMPARYRDDHGNGFRRAMADGRTHYRNGIPGVMVAVDGRGREQKITIPMLHVVQIDDADPPGPMAVGTMRVVPSVWSHWRQMVPWAALVLACALGLGVYANYSADRQTRDEIQDTRQRLNRQLIVIRDSVGELQSTLPEIVDGKVSPSDLETKLSVLYQKVDALVINGQQMSNDIDEQMRQSEEGK